MRLYRMACTVKELIKLVMLCYIYMLAYYENIEILLAKITKRCINHHSDNREGRQWELIHYQSCNCWHKHHVKLCSKMIQTQRKDHACADLSKVGLIQTLTTKRQRYSLIILVEESSLLSCKHSIKLLLFIDLTIRTQFKPTNE